MARHRRVYVVEQNRDAQLLGLMRLEFQAELIEKLRSVLHFNGLPLDARSITDAVLSQEGHEMAVTSTSQTDDVDLSAEVSEGRTLT